MFREEPLRARELRVDNPLDFAVDRVPGLWAGRKACCARAVRRFGGTVAGIVSINDILLTAGPRADVRSDQIVDAFQAICAHRHPAPHVAVA